MFAAGVIRQGVCMEVRGLRELQGTGQKVRVLSAESSPILTAQIWGSQPTGKRDSDQEPHCLRHRGLWEGALLCLYLSGSILTAPYNLLGSF